MIFEIVPLLPTANVLKVSEEELAFLTDTKNEHQGANHLLGLGISLILVTKGKGGCSYYTPNLSGTVSVAPVKAIDTTGAGDAFVGGFLYQLANRKISRHNLDSLIGDRNELEFVLRFANACGAITTTDRGAIPALPNRNRVEGFLKQQQGS